MNGAIFQAFGEDGQTLGWGGGSSWPVTIHTRAAGTIWAVMADDGERCGWLVGWPIGRPVTARNEFDVKRLEWLGEPEWFLSTEFQGGRMVG